MTLTDDFKAYIAGLNPPLKHFTAAELLTKTDRPQNHVPPRELWERIVKTARILDRLRVHTGFPIKVHSAYRSAAYNAKIGGAKSSQHIQYRAIDFSSAHPAWTPSRLAGVLKLWRKQGQFMAGIGLYKGFVHLDTRKGNADWYGKGVT